MKSDFTILARHNDHSTFRVWTILDGCTITKVFDYLHCTHFHAIIRSRHVTEDEPINETAINIPCSVCTKNMEVTTEELINSIKEASETNAPFFFLCNSRVAPISDGTIQINGPPAIKNVIHESIDRLLIKYGIYRNTAMMLDVRIAGTTRKL